MTDQPAEPTGTDEELVLEAGYVGQIIHTPDEWCRIQGVQVLDPDGWRGSNGRPWADPISLAEFQERLVGCTQRSIAGRGNVPASPISDELADAVLVVKERGVPCPPKCDYQTHRRAEMRAVLEAAYPAIRQQVAEEIAAALERSEDDARRAEKQTRDPGWSDIATGYMRSAELAREIGAKA